jgi:dTDP-4-amino-4,6-dideoxygalactose transaminase
MTAPHTTVALLDLPRQYAEIHDEIDAALRRVVESQRFVLGPEVEAFETEFARYCQSRFAVGCGSGSDALLLALTALGVGPGDEVICPAYTFFSTAGSIARLGAHPVFADIEPGGFNLDPEAARRAARHCTRLAAILPVDLFGQMADMEALLALGEEYHVHVIEDAAQAVGAEDPAGRRAGSVASVGCFSLYPSKNLGAFGDAGIVTTDEPELAERVGSLRIHGASKPYFHEAIGFNSRLDALQAAVLRVKLRHLDRWTDARRTNAAYYDRCFASAGASGEPDALRGAILPLRLPCPADGNARHVYHQYVIRVPAERREALRRELAEHHIATAIYYPLGLHQQSCFASLGYAPGDLPETEAAARENLALPVHPQLERAQLDHVIDCVVSFVSG